MFFYVGMKMNLPSDLKMGSSSSVCQN